MAFVNRRPDHFDLGSTTCHSQTNAAVVAGDTETTTSTHAFETSHMCSIDNCVNLTWCDGTMFQSAIRVKFPNNFD